MKKRIRVEPHVRADGSRVKGHEKTVNTVSATASFAADSGTFQVDPIPQVKDDIPEAKSDMDVAVDDVVDRVVERYGFDRRSEGLFSVCYASTKVHSDARQRVELSRGGVEAGYDQSMMELRQRIEQGEPETERAPTLKDDLVGAEDEVETAVWHLAGRVADHKGYGTYSEASLQVAADSVQRYSESTGIDVGTVLSDLRENYHAQVLGKG